MKDDFMWPISFRCECRECQEYIRFDNMEQTIPLSRGDTLVLSIHCPTKRQYIVVEVTDKYKLVKYDKEHMKAVIELGFTVPAFRSKKQRDLQIKRSRKAYLRSIAGLARSMV